MRVLIATTIPWWGAPLFTIIGGLGVAAVSQFTNTRRDGRAHERELQDRRVAVCNRLLVVVDELCYAIWWKLPVEFHLHSLHTVWSELELTCEETVRDLAQKVVFNYYAFKVEYEAKGESTARKKDHSFDKLAGSRWAYIVGVKASYGLEATLESG